MTSPRLQVGSLIRGTDGTLKLVTRLDSEAITYRGLYWWERLIRWGLMRWAGMPEPTPMSRQQTRAAVGRTVKRVARARARRWKRQRRGL